ncbi:MAG: MarR family winged helix-turn-helix transcriptional regulator [Clostridiales Family XIII bacterium]|jgi:DNA-binding MarR family transcriptional regulator|nr:MarR family winged helix-turn-helix transcriptional regulator [Clostridiales Family XIII bacterium]
MNGLQSNLQSNVSGMSVDAILARLFITCLKIEERVISEESGGTLSISELHVLREIGLGADRAMSQVAHGLKISVSALTIAMNKLEKKGYVVRERSNEDRRIVRLHLTDKGIEAYKLHTDFHTGMVNSALAGLSAEERTVLNKSLAQLESYFYEEWERVCGDK